MTDLRIVKTRTNIKNSLIDLLAEKNVSKITVTELAEKAMINRKTFYRHYHTVQDVVDDINYDIVNDVISHAKKSDRDGNNLVNQLNFIGLSIVENKEQINKILKNSPEVFGSGRSVAVEKIVHQILYTRYTMVSAGMSIIPEMMEKIAARRLVANR